MIVINAHGADSYLTVNVDSMDDYEFVCKKFKKAVQRAGILGMVKFKRYAMSRSEKQRMKRKINMRRLQRAAWRRRRKY